MATIQVMWVWLAILCILSTVNADKNNTQEEDDAPVFKRQASDYIDLDVNGPRLTASATGYSNGGGYGSTNEGNSGFSTNGGFQPIPGRPGSSIGNGDNNQQDESNTEGMPYSFEWSVNDQNHGNQYSHKQSSDGKITMGEYSVLLPDQRIQTVRFVADDVNGYVADVSYSGETALPEPRLTTGTSSRGAGARALSGNNKQSNESKKSSIGKEPIYYGNFGVQSRTLENEQDNNPFVSDMSNTINKEKLQQLKDIFDTKNSSSTYNYNASGISGSALTKTTFSTGSEDGFQGRSYEDGINLWEESTDSPKGKLEENENILHSQTGTSHRDVRRGVETEQENQESLPELENSADFHNTNSRQGTYYREDGEPGAVELQSTTMPTEEYSPLDKVTIFAELDSSTTEVYDYVTGQQDDAWTITPTVDTETATEIIEMHDQQNMTSDDNPISQEGKQTIEHGNNESKEKNNHSYPTKFYPKSVYFPTTATQPVRRFRSKITSKPKTTKPPTYKRPYLEKTGNLPKTSFEHFKNSYGRKNSRPTSKWIQKHMAKQEAILKKVNDVITSKTGTKETLTENEENSHYGNGVTVKNHAVEGMVSRPEENKFDLVKPIYSRDRRVGVKMTTVTKRPLYNGNVHKENWSVSTSTTSGRDVVEDEVNYGTDEAVDEETTSNQMTGDKQVYGRLNKKRRFGGPRFVNRRKYPRRNHGNRMTPHLNYWRPVHDGKRPIYTRENMISQGRENIDWVNGEVDVYPNQLVAKPMLGEIQDIVSPTVEYIFPTHNLESMPMMMENLTPLNQKPSKIPDAQQYYYVKLNEKGEDKNTARQISKSYVMPKAVWSFEEQVNRQPQTESPLTSAEYGGIEMGNNYETASRMPKAEHEFRRNDVTKNTNLYNNGNRFVPPPTGRDQRTENIQINNEDHLNGKMENKWHKQRINQKVRAIASSRPRQSYNPQSDTDFYGKSNPNLELATDTYPRTGFNAYRSEDIATTNRRKPFLPQVTDVNTNPAINVKMQSKIQYDKQGNTKMGNRFMSKPKTTDASRFGNTDSGVVSGYTDILTGRRINEGKETAAPRERNIYNKLQQPHRNGYSGNTPVTYDTMPPLKTKSKAHKTIFPSRYPSRNTKVKHNNDWYGIVPSDHYRNPYSEQRPAVAYDEQSQPNSRQQPYIKESNFQQSYYQSQDRNLKQPYQEETTYREGKFDATKFSQDITNNGFMPMNGDNRYGDTNVNNVYKTVETDIVTLNPKDWILNSETDNVTQGESKSLLDGAFSMSSEDNHLVASAGWNNQEENYSSNNETIQVQNDTLLQQDGSKENKTLQGNEQLRELIEQYMIDSVMTTSPHPSTKSFGDKTTDTELKEGSSRNTNVGNLELATIGPIVHATPSQSVATTTPMNQPLQLLFPVFQHNNSVS